MAVKKKMTKMSEKSPAEMRRDKKMGVKEMPKESMEYGKGKKAATKKAK